MTDVANAARASARAKLRRYRPVEPIQWGKRLRAAREAAGVLSVNEAALRLGKPQAQISQIETRSSVPSAATVHLYVMVLGADPGMIFAAADPVDKRTS